MVFKLLWIILVPFIVRLFEDAYTILPNRKYSSLFQSHQPHENWIEVLIIVYWTIEGHLNIFGTSKYLSPFVNVNIRANFDIGGSRWQKNIWVWSKCFSDCRFIFTKIQITKIIISLAYLKILVNRSDEVWWIVIWIMHPIFYGKKYVFKICAMHRYTVQIPMMIVTKLKKCRYR